MHFGSLSKILCKLSIFSNFTDFFGNILFFLDNYLTNAKSYLIMDMFEKYAQNKIGIIGLHKRKVHYHVQDRYQEGAQFRRHFDGN